MAVTFIYQFWSYQILYEFQTNIEEIVTNQNRKNKINKNKNI